MKNNKKQVKKMEIGQNDGGQGVVEENEYNRKTIKEQVRKMEIGQNDGLQIVEGNDRGSNKETQVKTVIRRIRKTRT